MAESVWALGLMSGTSLDGLDAALIKTDGRTIEEFGPTMTEPLDDELRLRILLALEGKGDMLRLENDITFAHIDIVKKLLKKADIKKKDVEVIGFHGQSILHQPEDNISWQMGNGALMAYKTGINTVCDFRRKDVAAGGEGAPLVPLYHAALVRDMELPIALLNIGGMANVTWIGRSEEAAEHLMALDIIAFDTGPGNVLIDEWMRRNNGTTYDKDGELAKRGTVHLSIVEDYLNDDYFKKYPPKSLDRADFSLKLVEKLSPEDGAATLAAFTAEAAIAAQKHFPAEVKRWLICGGGRHNPVIMKHLSKNMENVAPIEAIDLEGDAIEAQAFAFLAVRSMHKLPLSLPTTTGAIRAVTGGAFYPA